MKTIFRSVFFISVFASFFCSCGGNGEQDDKAFVAKVDSFLVSYNNKWRELNTIANEASWRSQTYMVKGDTATENAANRTNDALAQFLGSAVNIKTTQEFLKQKDKLSPIQVEQLQHILYFAGGSPQTVSDLVSKKIKAETEATKLLYDFDYKLGGKSVTTND